MHHASDLATNRGIFAPGSRSRCPCLHRDDRLRHRHRRPQDMPRRPNGARATRSSRAGGSKSATSTAGSTSRPSEGNQVEIVAQKKARGISEDAAKEAPIASRSRRRSRARRSASRPRCRRRTACFVDRRRSATRCGCRLARTSSSRPSTAASSLSRLTGKIDAETTNGGIVAREVGGPIEATTTNGGVEVELTQVARGGVKLECTNGGIKLRLPSDAAATISASVANGGIDADGLKLETTDSSRRSLEARMNGGGPMIKIEGTNGGIKLAAR